MSNDHNTNNDDRTYEKIQKEVSKIMVKFTSKYIEVFENAPLLEDVEKLMEIYEKEEEATNNVKNRKEDADLLREKIKELE